MANLTWGSSQDLIEVGSESQLSQLISELSLRAAGRPVLAELQIDNGDLMSIGLGRTVTVIEYTRASREPPFMVSQGNEAEAGYVSFEYAGESSEYPMAFAIPLDQGIAALLHFYRTGELLPEVHWIPT